MVSTMIYYGETCKSWGYLDMNNLYTYQEATMRKEFGNTSWLKIRKGVRQGCVLSPCLFNFYTESIMRKAGVETIQGITIGRE